MSQTPPEPPPSGYGPPPDQVHYDNVMKAASQVHARVTNTPNSSAYVPGGSPVGSVMATSLPGDYFDFLDDGPQKAGEDYPTYRNRVIRSRISMNIARRPLQLPPATAQDFPDRQAYDNFMKKSKYVQEKRTNANHKKKLDPLNPGFDEEYVRQWKTQKDERHAWNTRQRREAHQRKVQFFAASGLPRPPTPDPPEDSGDELLDTELGTLGQHGISVNCTACKRSHITCDIEHIGIPCTHCQKRKKECNYVFTKRAQRTVFLSEIMCENCSRLNRVCDIRTIGIPCTRCTSDGIGAQCKGKRIIREERGGKRRDDSNTVAPTSERSRQRTKQPRRRRSASPPRGPEADPVPNPCANCVKNGRTCTTSRPCNPCILYNERHLCDAVHQGHNFAADAVDDEDYGTLGMDFDGPDFNLSSARVPEGQQQRGLSPSEQMLYSALYDSLQTAHSAPFDLPIRNSGSQLAPAPEPASFISLPQIEHHDSTSPIQQPLEVQRTVQQAARSRRRTPEQEQRNTTSNWELRQRLETATPELGSVDPFPVYTGGDEFLFSDFLNDGSNLPYQYGDDTDMGMPDDWADPGTETFSGASVGAPDIPPQEGTLAEPVLPNYGDSEPPNTPVLGNFRQTRNARDELLSFVSYCSELYEYFVPEVRRSGIKCSQQPGKKCDEFSHGDFCTCSKCHEDQNNHWRLEQDAVVELTKVYMCKPCAADAKRKIREFPTDVQLGNCLCVGQMKKSWLCHFHREKAIKAVKTRAGLVGEWLARNRRGTCWCCERRPEDRSTESWRCKGCREQVVVSVY